VSSSQEDSDACRSLHSETVHAHGDRRWLTRDCGRVGDSVPMEAAVANQIGRSSIPARLVYRLINSDRPLPVCGVMGDELYLSQFQDCESRRGTVFGRPSPSQEEGAEVVEDLRLCN
jgi:hypothetical protein